MKNAPRPLPSHRRGSCLSTTLQIFTANLSQGESVIKLSSSSPSFVISVGVGGDAQKGHRSQSHSLVYDTTYRMVQHLVELHFVDIKVESSGCPSGQQDSYNSSPPASRTLCICENKG